VRPLVSEGTLGLVSAENGRGSVGRGTAGRSADVGGVERVGSSSRPGNVGSIDSAGLTGSARSSGLTGGSVAGAAVIGGVTRGLAESLGNGRGLEGAGVIVGVGAGVGVGVGVGVGAGAGAGAGVGVGVGVGVTPCVVVGAVLGLIRGASEFSAGVVLGAGVSGNRSTGRDGTAGGTDNSGNAGSGSAGSGSDGVSLGGVVVTAGVRATGGSFSGSLNDGSNFGSAGGELVFGCSTGAGSRGSNGLKDFSGVWSSRGLVAAGCGSTGDRMKGGSSDGLDAVAAVSLTAGSAVSIFGSSIGGSIGGNEGSLNGSGSVGFRDAVVGREVVGRGCEFSSGPVVAGKVGAEEDREACVINGSADGDELVFVLGRRAVRGLGDAEEDEAGVFPVKNRLPAGTAGVLG
jgi:hypothetical protein